MGYDFIAVKRPTRVPLPNNAHEISPQIWETIYTHYYQLGDSYYIIDNNMHTADFCINVHTAEQLSTGLLADRRELFENVFGGFVVSGAAAAELAEQILIALEQGEYPGLLAEIVQNFALFLRFAGQDGILIVS
jgi:hypothetical protein